MAVIEEYDEKAERTNEEKKRAHERRKEAAERGSNLGPKGPSLEKAKPTGFARGFLDSERAKEGLTPETEHASEAVQSKRSVSASKGLADEKKSEGGSESAGHSKEEQSVRDEKRQNAAATSSSPDKEDKREAADVHSKRDPVRGTTPKGFAKGFLNPQAKQVGNKTEAGPQIGDVPSADTSQAMNASGTSKDDAERSKNEPGREMQSATGRSDIAAHIERETERDLPREPESGPSVTARAEDTWSTESQPSETAKSELHEEAAGSALQGSKERAASVPSERETEQHSGKSQEGDAKAQSNGTSETASTPVHLEFVESNEQGEEKSAASEGMEEEDEFHDACEDEEQQRQQSLARAEEVRRRGNALYAAGDYQGALEVYSQALELAPPAFTPVDKEVKRENEPSEDADRQQGTSEESVAVAEGRPDDGIGSKKRSDNGETRSQTESEVNPGLKAKGPRRMRPPKVLDPKTGKLVVPDEDEATTSGGAEIGAKEGGEGEKEVPDQEAIDCRAACHANRAACFVQLELHDAVVKECNAALKLKPDYVKVLVRRAQASDKLDRQEEALADWKSVLEKDPSHRQARAEIRRLEPLVNEKREKMKDEMLGKLKDLGNSVLGHFGMSVDNFKAVKDPNTGGYSINFSK